MKRFSIYISDEEYDFLCLRANEEHVSLSEYVAIQLFPNRITQTVSLTTAIERAKELTSGAEFTIPELFSFEEYSNISRGIAGTIGREFNKRVKNDLQNDFIELGRRNRQTVYRRL